MYRKRWLTSCGIAPCVIHRRLPRDYITPHSKVKIPLQPRAEEHTRNQPFRKYGKYEGKTVENYLEGLFRLANVRSRRVIKTYLRVAGHKLLDARAYEAGTTRDHHYLLRLSHVCRGTACEERAQGRKDDALVNCDIVPNCCLNLRSVDRKTRIMEIPQRCAERYTKQDGTLFKKHDSRRFIAIGAAIQPTCV